jgi:hypothetical protein
MSFVGLIAATATALLWAVILIPLLDWLDVSASALVYLVYLTTACVSGFTFFVFCRDSWKALIAAITIPIFAFAAFLYTYGSFYDCAFGC